jgi:hypothetical protein
MIQTIEAANGGYRFMPGVRQYSCGIAALSGFSIERICFSNVVPLRQGFEKIAEMIKAAGRPLTAFGACELRSPAPFQATAVLHSSQCVSISGKRTRQARRAAPRPDLALQSPARGRSGI